MPTELILNKQQYSSLIIKERCDSRTRSSPSLIIVGFSSSSQKIKRKGKKNQRDERAGTTPRLEPGDV